MTNTELSNDHAVSSSFGTPHLKINHQVAIDLDSSHAFEGPEKLLEIWFSPSANPLHGCSKSNGLKAISEDVWKDVLDRVNCKVLSSMAYEHVDQYLLSESNMVVYPHKVILKTCGTTTLLRGVQKILEVAAVYAGFHHQVGDLVSGTPTAAIPYRVFYSRKNFRFPDKQISPHRSWADEVKCLDGIFQEGSAYVVGNTNGEHWYHYLTKPWTTLTPPTTPGRSSPTVETEAKFSTTPRMTECDPEDEEQQDETLEILMTDLDPENAKQFHLEEARSVAERQFFHDAHRRGSFSSDGAFANGKVGFKSRKNSGIFDVFDNSSADAKSDAGDQIPPELLTEGHALGSIVTKACGLNDVFPLSKYPDSRIDAYLFSPCGFSANGLIPQPNGTGEPGTTPYFTVHVTPEPQCSYASFETNVPGHQSGWSTAEIVEHVVNIFKPARFIVTLFQAKQPAFDELHFGADGTAKRARMNTLKGFRRAERSVQYLDGYDLYFWHYVKENWKGGAPRIGENLG
ncbi:MAG: spermidine resistance protein [Vezdaea aestivalis]|nr:MAG: spermidine resistance protein [Vezdaea aestivalis]